MLPPTPNSLLFPYTTLFRSPGLGGNAIYVYTPDGNPFIVPRHAYAVDAKIDDTKPSSGIVRSANLSGHPYACLTGAGKYNISERSEEHTSELQSRENLVCRL